MLSSVGGSFLTPIFLAAFSALTWFREIQSSTPYKNPIQTGSMPLDQPLLVVLSQHLQELKVLWLPALPHGMLVVFHDQGRSLFCHNSSRQLTWYVALCWVYCIVHELVCTSLGCHVYLLCLWGSRSLVQELLLDNVTVPQEHMCLGCILPLCLTYSWLQ